MLTAMAVSLPVRKALRVYQGDTKRIPLRWYTDRTRTTGLNVSARTYASKIKDQVGGSVLATATVDTTYASEGLVYIVYSATDTAALPLTGSPVFDIQETNGTDVTTLVAGPVTVEGQVT